jgi:hypothetical protein
MDVAVKAHYVECVAWGAVRGLGVRWGDWEHRGHLPKLGPLAMKLELRLSGQVISFEL